MRNLIDIIDKIVEVAPDLEGVLRSTRKSVLYSAPEMMGLRWWETEAVLNSQAAKHPKADEIAKIFSGAEL